MPLWTVEEKTIHLAVERDRRDILNIFFIVLFLFSATTTVDERDLESDIRITVQWLKGRRKRQEVAEVDETDR